VRTAGLLLLAGASYYAYKNRVRLGLVRAPAAAPPITTPGGTVVPIQPPGLSCPANALDVVIPWLAAPATKAALAAATNPQTSYKTVQAIVALLERYPAGCRPALAQMIKETGVHRYFVDNAMAQAR